MSVTAIALPRAGRWLAFALAASFALAALALAIQPADAQALSCYQAVYGVRRTSFGPGLVFERTVRIGTKFDESCYSVNDDRVNFRDHAAEAAIYCRPEGIAIWDIDILSRGTPAFLVTWDVIDAIPHPLEANLLLGEHGGFQLYALTSGELQLNSPPNWEGKSYVFTWPGCERPVE